MPVVDLGEGEVGGEALHLGDLPAVGEQAEVEDLRSRVRGLRAGGRVLRPKLEEVLCRGMVEP